MIPSEEARHPSIQQLAACDEILQVMYWLRGEGLAAVVAAGDLSRWIGLSAEAIGSLLERLAATGLVQRVEKPNDPASAGQCGWGGGLGPTRFRLKQFGILNLKRPQGDSCPRLSLEFTAMVDRTYPITGRCCHHLVSDVAQTEAPVGSLTSRFAAARFILVRLASRLLPLLAVVLVCRPLWAQPAPET